MKRSAAQDIQFRNYKATANAKLLASFAKPEAPEASWWANANGEFYDKARQEFTRMRTSTFGQQSKLILGGPAVERRKVNPDETVELEA